MTDTLRRLDLVTAPPAEQLADYLASLLGPARPRRVSKMLDPGGDKYRDVPRHVPLDRTKLLAHATGRETWAATLDQAGHCRAGVIEVDQGGRPAVVSVLSAAQKAGLSCYAIAVDNPLSGHSGGHIFFTYTENTENICIVAQLQQVASAAGLSPDTEIWPCGQVIRLPFGYHRWAKTRGTLISQAGELIELDQDLAAGLDLVLSLRPNAAPEMLANVSIPAPAQTSDKGDYAKSGHVATRPAPLPIAKVSPGEQAAGRMASGRINVEAISAAVRERFNAEHDWAELLSSYGGTETRDGWACNCGWQHSHNTQIAITSQDKIVSFTPNCGWAPLKGSGRALDKFGFYVDREYGGDFRTARNTLARAYGLWVEPRAQKRTETPQPATNYRTAAQVADADRKRTERRQAAERLRDTVISRAAIDDLPWQARLLLDTHLKLANQRGWHRASIARIAEELGRGDRWVQRFNEYLIDIYVSRTLTTRHDTSIWTLLEKPIQRAATLETDEPGVITFEPENSERSPEYISKEILDTDLLELVSGGQSPQSASVYPPTQPAWQLAAVERWSTMSDAELNERLGLACSQGEAGPIALNTEQPEQNAVEPVSLDCLDASKGVYTVSADALELKGFADCADAPKNEQPSAARLLAELFRRQGRADDAAVWKARIAQPVTADVTPVEQFVQDSALKSAPVADVSPTKNPEPFDGADNEHYTQIGATYDPIYDWTNGGAYIAPRALVERAAPIIQLDPLVQAPPLSTDATYGEFIWRYYAARPGSICKRTGKPWSDGQRRRFKREAESYLVDVSPAEAALRWDAMRQPRLDKVYRAPRSQARPPAAGPAFDQQPTLNL